MCYPGKGSPLPITGTPKRGPASNHPLWVPGAPVPPGQGLRFPSSPAGVVPYPEVFARSGSLLRSGRRFCGVGPYSHPSTPAPKTFFELTPFTGNILGRAAFLGEAVFSGLPNGWDSGGKGEGSGARGSGRRRTRVLGNCSETPCGQPTRGSEARAAPSGVVKCFQGIRRFQDREPLISLGV